jgi:hypothetical protein
MNSKPILNVLYLIHCVLSSLLRLKMNLTISRLLFIYFLCPVASAEFSEHFPVNSRNLSMIICHFSLHRHSNILLMKEKKEKVIDDHQDPSLQSHLLVY